jgi:hypothetical protein
MYAHAASSRLDVMVPPVELVRRQLDGTVVVEVVVYHSCRQKHTHS